MRIDNFVQMICCDMRQTVQAMDCPAAGRGMPISEIGGTLLPPRNFNDRFYNYQPNQLHALN